MDCGLWAGAWAKKAESLNCGLGTADCEVWTVDSSNLQITAGSPNDEQVEVEQKELEAEELRPVFNAQDKKGKTLGENKRILGQRPNREAGGNRAPQQMATEAKVWPKHQKIKNVRNGSLVLYIYVL